MDEQIQRNFGAIWPQHVRNLAGLLIAARAACGNDLDQVLVLAIIGDRTFPTNWPYQEADYAQWASGAAGASPEGTNIRSIADYSGIPKETVRRKVARLIERGWVERDANGLLRATAKAKAELEPATEQSIRYLAHMNRTLAKHAR